MNGRGDATEQAASERPSPFEGRATRDRLRVTDQAIEVVATPVAAMSAVATLSGDRSVLRPWGDADRDAFASLNADARVMEFFRSPLSRAESDAMVDYLQAHLDKRGFSLWAVEVPGEAPFIGFTGLLVPGFSAHFTPCVEIGWRLASAHWGRGYATEAARLALGYGFATLGLAEIVSYTSVTNRRSRAVMERLGMRRDPADDFDHPAVPEGHPLRRHEIGRAHLCTPV